MLLPFAWEYLLFFPGDFRMESITTGNMFFSSVLKQMKGWHHRECYVPKSSLESKLSKREGGEASF